MEDNQCPFRMNDSLVMESSSIDESVESWYEDEDNLIGVVEDGEKVREDDEFGEGDGSLDGSIPCSGKSNSCPLLGLVPCQK